MGGAIFSLSQRPLTNVLIDVRGEETVVFALSPHSQRLYKLLHTREQREARLLAVYKLGDSRSPVQQLTLLPGEYLYATFDTHVAQYRLGQCSLYNSYVHEGK